MVPGVSPIGACLRVFVAVILIAGATSFFDLAHAQPADAEIGEASVFLTLFPQLRQLGPPEWLLQGVRVSYEAAGASFMGPAGSGVVQYDVASVDNVQAFGYVHAYGDSGAGVVPLYQLPARGLPGLGPFWINPAVLVNAEQAASGELTITRYQKDIAGQQATVVRFQTNSLQGQTVYEFEATSGLMVFQSFEISGSAGQVSFLGLRTLPIPWTMDRAPNWVRPQAQLDYAGTRVTQISGAGQVEQPVQSRVTILEAATRWSLQQMSFAVQGSVSESVTVSGVGMLGGSVWLPRGALSSQIPTEPAELDQDPFTGARLFLVADQGFIILQQSLSGARITWLYDPVLGVLQRQLVEMQTPTSYEETDVTLVGGSDLETLNQMEELPEVPGPTPGTNGGDGEEDVVIGTGGGGKSTGGCNTAGSPIIEEYRGLDGLGLFFLVILLFTLASKSETTQALQRLARG